MLKKQIVFTEQEWTAFRRRLCEEFVDKSLTDFRLVDRETDKEIVDRRRDYCCGIMGLMIEAALVDE